MKKFLLLSFIAVFVMSFIGLAVEKPQSIIEKPGLNAKEKNDTYSPFKDFGLFKGKYSWRSNPSTEAVFLNEGFEGTFPPTGWSLVNFGAGFVQTTLRVHSGTYSAYHNDNSGEQDDWLVTPAIDLTGSVSARLNFWQNENYGTWYELHQIYVTTDTTGIMGDTTAWTLVYQGVGPEDVWEQVIVDLSAYDGQTIFLGFYYSGNYADEWYLDDVIVEDAPTAPIMEILFSELTAPPTPIGTTVSDTFGILRNSGGGVLNVSSITLTNPDFAVSPSSGAVNPGDTLFVLASFTPSTSGLINGLIIISGDDPANPSDTIQVSGVGYPADYALEQFNDFPYYPYNFSRINANGDAYQWGWYGLIAAGDTNFVAGIRWATLGNDDYLVTPPIPVVTGDYISFESWVYSASYPETWQVLVSTTDNQASSFTVGLDTVTSNITSPIRYTYDLSAFDGQTIYVTIRNISVDMYYQWVDNVIMPMPNYPLFINEVYYDSPGTDAGTFTELFGKPGVDLTGYTLEGINGNGGASYRTVDLLGVIPQDGFFVVGQDVTVPNYDLIANVDWQNGPDNVVLRKGVDTLDALGYGDFSVPPDINFVGEGNPAVDVFPGVSLSRYDDGNDTNDNSADFHATYPTPGEVNHAAEPIIGGGSALDFGTVAVGSDSSRDYIIYNNGSVDLVVSSIVTSNPDFTTTLPGTIIPGGSDTITVTFAPTQGVTYTDSMTINSNDPVNGARTVSLTGIGEGVTPLVEFFDNFDAYTAGTQLAVQNPTVWTTWSNAPGTGEDPYVSNAHAYSGSNSVVIVQNNDLVKTLGQQTSGKWIISFQAYIPAGKAGYFNTLAGYTPNPFNWAMEAYFDASGEGRLFGGSTTAVPFSYSHDAWMLVEVIVDLDNDVAEFLLNGLEIHSWQWTLGSSGSGSPLRLDANDFFGATANDEMYVDDYYFRALPKFFDDFDAYIAGTQLAVQNPTVWTTWSNAPGTGEDPYVSNAHAYSGANSVVIAQNNDLVKTLGQQTSGKWRISFRAYIPAGKAGYFNTLAGFTPNPYNWGMEAYFDASGEGRLFGGSSTVVPFSYSHDAWTLVELIVDLNNDLAEFHVNSSTIHSWTWTLGASGGGSPLRLDANDFFGATANDEMYVDDYYFRLDTTFTGISSNESQLPKEFALNQNYPNPFNPTTTITYALKENAQVTLKIYNTLGQEVRTLINARQEAGYKQVVWDGLNTAGARVASGIYIYRIEAGNFVQARKMVLMK